MRLIYDLHTHTTYSHGKGSIEDNVLAAIAAGLDTIGISDHGPGHVTYGVRRSDIPRMRSEIDGLRERYPQIKILLGVEANIIDRDGLLDIAPEDAAYFDYINAGYHYGVFGREPLFAAKIHCVNLCRETWHAMAPRGKGRRPATPYLEGGRGARSINTELIIKALYANTIRVLTHPGAKADVHIDAIAKACAERDTLMEINDGHGFLTVEGIKAAAATNVRFIIGSDAHRPERVGRMRRALRLAREAGLDPARIVNLEE